LTRIPRAVVSAVALAATASAVYASHSWGNYHWASTSPGFTLQAGDNVSSVWDPYLDEAISDWNGATDELTLQEVVGGARPRNCRPTAGRIEVCNATYGNNGWLGIAQIWISGSHITQAITKVNDTYFNTATYNTPAWRRLVMCQEIAHDFGLGHQDETFDNPNLGSCMDYTNDPDGGAGGADPNDPSNEHPNAHDTDQLSVIYNHVDSSSTVGQATSGMPAAANQVVANAPGSFGRLVHASANGQHEVYEMDFGGGKRLITDVLWTTEAADHGHHNHEE